MATVEDRTTVADACPACSSRARTVVALTVRSLVKPELADRVRDGAYRFCASATCDVAYFGATDPAQRFLRSDLRVPVGQKETRPSIQVCYCFDWITEDLERELRLTSETMIPDRIRQKVQQGLCHCETMNPQGTCCLGNVSRAVKDIRARLALAPRTEGAGSTAPPDGRGKGAWLATLGAMFTAVAGSACCWLPLLLIAFGFSAAGVGSFFEQYRTLFLTTTVVLLGAAWFLTCRVAIRRAWARLTGKRAPSPAAEACCAGVIQPTAAHSCCAAEPEPADCCATQTSSVSGQSDRKSFTMRQFNEVMLWMATAIVLLFALFPHWVSLLFGGSRPPTAVSTDGQQIVLEVQGMTCEGCVVTARQALSKVPGVEDVEVSYDRAEAVVTVQPGATVQPAALVQAAREAGYDAKPKK